MTSIRINPIYNKIFDEQFSANELQSTEAELRHGPEEVDFSLTEKSWVDTAKTVTLTLLKIILFPWGLYTGLRWCIQRLLMAPLYPAQSSLVQQCVLIFQTEFLDQGRVELAGTLPDSPIIRHVTLEKDGIRLSGLMITTPQTLTNGKWVLQATGNTEPVERGATRFPYEYQKIGYNVLLVNNPGVGRSEGTATPESIGECQNTAIEYLKTALKAEKIVLAGYSIGGGSIGQAVLQHDFTEDKDKFLVVQQVTFSRTSDAAHIHAPKCLQWCAKALIRWAGCEMDSVEASQKLLELGIPEVVIQGETDTVIPLHTSLIRGIQPGQGMRTTEEKALLQSRQIVLPGVGHGDCAQVLQATIEKIQQWELTHAPLQTQSPLSSLELQH